MRDKFSTHLIGHRMSTLPKNLIADKPLQELFSSVVTLQKYVNVLKMND